MKYYKKTGNPGKKHKKKILGLLFVLAGIAVALHFFFPVISYQLFLASAYEGNKVEVPIPKRLVVNKTSDFGSLLSQGFASLTTNFNDARNWYPGFAGDSFDKKVPSYKLSIPKLKIENAEVSTKDYNVDQHLVQYFGTALPGDDGTAVIFGHSTIPAWFDPKNYKKIFATLHTIKTGDEIFVNVSGVTYKYKVFSILITTPEDTNTLLQSYDNSYLTLVTCTPPGTIWKRLVVRAALESAVN